MSLRMRIAGAIVTLALGWLTAIGQGAAQDIIVGAPNSLTGGYGEAGQRVVSGLEIAASEINAAGGIMALGGAKLRVIPADTSSDNPSQAASVTRRLITQDGAVVLVGAHTSTMTLSAQIEAERAEVPLITTSYADQIVERGYKYTFKVAPQASEFLRAGMGYIIDMFRRYRGEDPKRIAIFYGTDAASQAAGEAALDLAEQHGLDVVATAQFPSGLTDPTPVISPLLQTKPDVLFLNSFTSDVIMLTRAMRNLGLDMPIVSGGGGISTHTIGEALGEDANGLMGVVAWNWDLPIEGVPTFLELFKAQKPSEPFPPTFEAVGEGYAIGWLIKEALEQAGSSDPKAIRDALATLEMPAPLPGGRIKFNEAGLNTELSPIMVGWISGELRTVWPEEYQTKKPEM